MFSAISLNVAVVVGFVVAAVFVFASVVVVVFVVVVVVVVVAVAVFVVVVVVVVVVVAVVAYSCTHMSHTLNVPYKHVSAITTNTHLERC